jgi:hypothetical protein
VGEQCEIILLLAGYCKSREPNLTYCHGPALLAGPTTNGNGAVLLTMANFGAHAALLAANFAPSSASTSSPHAGPPGLKWKENCNQKGIIGEPVSSARNPMRTAFAS